MTSVLIGASILVFWLLLDHLFGRGRLGQLVVAVTMVGILIIPVADHVDNRWDRGLFLLGGAAVAGVVSILLPRRRPSGE